LGGRRDAGIAVNHVFLSIRNLHRRGANLSTAPISMQIS
jgi:hypothetical protein